MSDSLYQELVEELVPVAVEQGDSPEPQTPPLNPTNEGEEDLQKLDFTTPVELLAFLHPAVYEKTITLHKWQIEVNEELGLAKPNSRHPYKFCLCAANGSGKDAFVIAPFATWFILTKIRSLVVITSASGVQLTNQTENYIKSLCTRANNFYKPIYGKDILKINQRSVKCLLSGSEIVMFSTDEEGRAEGYHPLEPGAEMAIIVNEAKTVSPEIFRALRRCTGYNYWLNVSTPGEPHGDFYNSFENWPHRRRVTYFDCPHQSPDEFETDKIELGEHSLLFRSKWLALFTSVSSNTVVSQVSIEKLKGRLAENQVPTCGQHWPIRVGIDIAAGGDETVVSVWRGNLQLDQVCFREEDVEKTSSRIEQALLKHKLTLEHDHIFADDGGIGKAVIQSLRRKKWNIKRILNNSPAVTNKKDYKNRGMENWYKFGRLVDLCYIKPLDDEKLWSQLGSRHYKKSVDAAISKLQLESKSAEMAAGFKSPDRADAAVLAFSDVSVEKLRLAIEGFDTTQPQTPKYDTDELVQHYEDMLYSGQLADVASMLEQKYRGSGKYPVGALSAKLKEYNGSFARANRWH